MWRADCIINLILYGVHVVFVFFFKTKKIYLNSRKINKNEKKYPNFFKTLIKMKRNYGKINKNEKKLENIIKIKKNLEILKKLWYFFFIN